MWPVGIFFINFDQLLKFSKQQQNIVIKTLRSHKKQHHATEQKIKRKQNL